MTQNNNRNYKAITDIYLHRGYDFARNRLSGAFIRPDGSGSRAMGKHRACVQHWFIGNRTLERNEAIPPHRIRVGSYRLTAPHTDFILGSCSPN